MTLYEQLMYIHERGFYPVVHSKKDGLYQIFSTKGFYGDLRMTDGYKTLESAKENIGERTGYTKEELAEEWANDWEIVDTIHPSELMGKGFQVGDKVEVAGGIYTLVKINGPTVVIRNNTSVKDITTDYNHLKPVLPQEVVTESDHLKESNSIPSKTARNPYLVEDQLGYFTKEEKKEKEESRSLKELADFTKEICESIGSPTKELKEFNQKLKTFTQNCFSKKSNESNSIPLVCEDVNEMRLLKQCPTCHVKYTTKLDDSDYKEEKKECEHEWDSFSIYCKRCGFSKKTYGDEQITCKHDWEEHNVGTYPYYGENQLSTKQQWWCYNCGLVTCKNPNQE